MKDKGSCKKCNGSFTVEAAFVIPWVLFAITGFLYFYVYMSTQFQVYQSLMYISDELYPYGTAMTYLGNTALSYGNIESGNDLFDSVLSEIKERAVCFAGDGLSEIYIKELAADYYDDNNIVLNCVEGGAEGVDYSIEGMLGGGEITLCAEYTFSFPMDFFKITDKRICRRITINTFSGSEWNLTGEFEKEKEESGSSDSETAYVTVNGTVYHLNRDCIYITTRFYGVLLSEINDLRNKSGGKYYPCERCDDTPAGSEVYISDYGTVYHTHDSCPAMIRNVKEIPLSEAKENYTPCSKCGEMQDS